MVFHFFDSNTYNEIEMESELLWKYQRHNLVNSRWEICIPSSISLGFLTTSAKMWKRIR